jgi:hypothetical protein
MFVLSAPSSPSSVMSPSLFLVSDDLTSVDELIPVANAIAVDGPFDAVSTPPPILEKANFMYVSKYLSLSSRSIPMMLVVLTGRYSTATRRIFPQTLCLVDPSSCHNVSPHQNNVTTS